MCPDPSSASSCFRVFSTLTDRLRWPNRRGGVPASNRRNQPQNWQSWDCFISGGGIRVESSKSSFPKSSGGSSGRGANGAPCLVCTPPSNCWPGSYIIILFQVVFVLSLFPGSSSSFPCRLGRPSRYKGSEKTGVVADGVGDDVRRRIRTLAGKASGRNG